MALGSHRLRFAICVMLAGVCLGVPGAAAHADVVFTTTLAGSNESPPNASTATGTATVIYETAGNGFRYDIVFSGLTTSIAAGHIHFDDPATPNPNGPVILGFGNVPATTSGRFGGFLTQADIETTPAAIATGLDTIAEILQQGLSGNLYVNLHNATFPGGEIRGDLVADTSAISLPGTSALMGVALLGLGLGMRRRNA